MSSAVRVLVAAVIVMATTGCESVNEIGERTRARAADSSPPASSATPASSAPTSASPTARPTEPAAGPAVLFDRTWVVEEGVWFLTTRDYPRFEVLDRTTGLLSTEPGSIVVNGPALYGKYRVRIEVRDRRPPLSDRCEDVVEVPFPLRRGSFWMGSFESGTRLFRVTEGSYRVRYCATGLDSAAEETAEDEFDGDDYRLYTGYHLFQFWEAERARPRVVKQMSAFAASMMPR